MTGRQQVRSQVQETEQEPAEEPVPEWGVARVPGTLLLP